MNLYSSPKPNPSGPDRKIGEKSSREERKWDKRELWKGGERFRRPSKAFS